MEVSAVNREFTILTRRVCGIISEGDTSVNTTKTITTTAYIGIKPRQFSVTKKLLTPSRECHSKYILINICTMLKPVCRL